MKSKKTAKDICEMFGVMDTFKLGRLFAKNEQRVFVNTRSSVHFSYDQHKHIHVKIVRSLEHVCMKSWRNIDVVRARVILWLYHHHMISVAS